MFIDLSKQSQYGIKNSIFSNLRDANPELYQMRLQILENSRGKFGNYIHINVKYYGYDNIEKFKEDYESMTFNFNFNMNTIYQLSITIKISDIGNIENDNKGLNAFFQDNINKYNNNSGNYHDNYINWIFNIENNKWNAWKPFQNVSLRNGERLNKIYINNLLWTNDTPSSGQIILSSTWFKIMAFKCDSNDWISIQYQFITIFQGATGYKMESNWNLQTTSLVINPKSST